jgi:tetratricopeptide (TPR) repeat protein
MSADTLSRAQELAAAGYRAQQLGDYLSATRLFEDALRLIPDDSGLMGMRGMLDLASGMPDEAERWVQKALRLSPDDSRLHNFLGQVYAGQAGSDRGIAAERAFARAVTLDPGFFEAWCNLGICLQKTHQMQEALDAFGRALALAPGDAPLHLALAEVHYLLGNLDEVEKLVRKPGVQQSTTGQLWLAMVLRAQGRVPESEALEGAVLARSQIREVYPVLVKFGRTDVLVGNLDQAEYWLNKAISLDPSNPSALIALSETRKFKAEDRDLVQSMESLVVDQPMQARQMEFALGKIHNDLGDSDQSFLHYAKANEIARRTVEFDADRMRADTDRKIAQFSSDFFAHAAAGSDSNVPVLIVGTPRSGTTLTEQIVSSHSQVGGAGELSYWGRLGGYISDNLGARYTRDVAETLATGYLNILRGVSRDSLRVTDKMPGNFNSVGLIHAVFPNAKIIHCQRNPVDACLSMFFQNFNEGHAYKFSLEGLDVFYREYLRLMQHWRETLPEGTLYEIRYEDMVEDTEGESQKLMAFLGLEWEEGQMDFFKKERPVFTCSKWQVRQPIYKTSKARWKRYEKNLGPILGLLELYP